MEGSVLFSIWAKRLKGSGHPSCLAPFHLIERLFKEKITPRQRHGSNGLFAVLKTPLDGLAQREIPSSMGRPADECTYPA